MGSDDFDGTTGNLCRNSEGLEEGCLAWLHTGVSGGDDDLVGGEGTGTSRGGDLVGCDDITDFLEVSLGEDETDVSLDLLEESLVLRVLGEGTSECSSDHGVLAHEDDTLASECETDLVHLLRGDVAVALRYMQISGKAGFPPGEALPAQTHVTSTMKMVGYSCIKESSFSK